jgi:hypothetical protein
MVIENLSLVIGGDGLSLNAAELAAFVRQNDK